MPSDLDNGGNVMGFDGIKDKIASAELVDLAFWLSPRTCYELIYIYRKTLIELNPSQKELIERICEVRSEQEFLRVLYEYGCKSREGLKIVKVNESFVIV